ncbi:MAG: mechanosensitive ion channel [Planctomycetes bacterium]|nr:mechanosensitive ion channel [Planctomycetota bacterium]
MLIADFDPRATWGLGLAAGSAVLYLVLRTIGRRYEARQHPLGGSFRILRNLVLPLATVDLALIHVAEMPESFVGRKLLMTLLALAGLHAALSFANAGFVAAGGDQGRRGKVPKLFLDILRFVIVLLGGAIAVSTVWGIELSGLITALGVGSLVVGLALQDTLGSVFAGVALLFERPFAVGEWVRIGTITGKVSEMNWRSTRLITRNKEQVVVPNLMLGKEVIFNFSQPTPLHREVRRIGFSYDDPPNRVKRVLVSCALSSRGVLATPPPEARVVTYADFFVEYEVLLYIDDYDKLNTIVDEFMTKVWYAAKRNNLTIPYPIRTVHMTQMPAKAEVPAHQRFTSALHRVPVFIPMDESELDKLAQEASLESFGKGERIVRQGEPGDALYVIVEGAAVVSISDGAGLEREVARLGRGEFFGEMALLTGEPRTAHVTAAEDLDVLVIYKGSLKGILERRPGLAQEMAEMVEARRHGLQAVRDMASLAPEKRKEAVDRTSQLVLRIRHFFGV